MSNIERVKNFIQHWENKDIDAILNTFSDTPFYHNIPDAPMETKEEIREMISAFLADVDEVHWVIKNIAADSRGIVLTERIDRFRFGESWLEIPLMGIFEFHGEQLARWVDYYDKPTLEARLAKILPASK